MNRLEEIREINNLTKKEIAKKMLEMKSDVEFIAEATGLSKNEVENLK